MVEECFVCFILEVGEMLEVGGCGRVILKVALNLIFKCCFVLVFKDK